MVNYNIEVSDKHKWPDCKYCDQEGMPTWENGDMDAIVWVCPHHKRVQREGWLDLVILVEESISG